MSNQPSLTRAIVLCGVALFSFFIASDYNPKPLPQWFRLVLVGMAVITALGAVAEGVNWLLVVVSARAEDFRRLAMINPMTETLRLMSNLSETAQVELSMHFATIGVDYIGMPTNDGPMFHFPVNGHRITAEFISEFLTRADDRHLPAVRQWSQGSIERIWADALTSWFIAHKYALPAIGNKPAMWHWMDQGRVSMHIAALKAFGLFEDE